MKLIKKIFIDDVEYPLVSDSLVFEENAPGRGLFVIHSSHAVSGLVKVYAGYDGEIKHIFTGYVYSCLSMDGKQERILVHELCAALNNTVPISGKNQSVKTVLKTLSDLSGLSFIIQKSAQWADKLRGHFVNLGPGINILARLGQAFDIPEYCWQPQPDGSVWVGDYYQSPLGKVKFDLDSKLIDQMSMLGGEMLFIPGFRPGVTVRIDAGAFKKITRVEINGSTMRLNWEDF